MHIVLPPRDLQSALSRHGIPFQQLSSRVVVEFLKDSKSHLVHLKNLSPEEHYSLLFFLDKNDPGSFLHNIERLPVVPLLSGGYAPSGEIYYGCVVHSPDRADLMSQLLPSFDRMTNHRHPSFSLLFKHRCIQPFTSKVFSKSLPSSWTRSVVDVSDPSAPPFAWREALLKLINTDWDRDVGDLQEIPLIPVKGDKLISLAHAT
jgi:hypothetical protein